MSKMFYDHLILIEELMLEIDALDVPDSDKERAKQLVDEILHHEVLTHILDLLPEENHEEFLEQFHRMPFDPQLLKYLDEKIETSVHQELTNLGIKLKKEILKDIKKHTTKKK